MRPDHSLRATLDETRRLVATSRRLFERNLEVYKSALATIDRVRARAAEANGRIQHHGPRRIARLRRLLIISRMEDGRLPHENVPIISGVPGFGGECEACDGFMPPTRMVMALPLDDTFVYIHADCYTIWAAQCRLRAALRRTS